MSNTYYLITFLLAELLTGLYLFVWRKNYDAHMTMIFMLIPVVNFGYMLFSRADTEEAALNATLITYMGGCFLQMIIMFMVVNLCKIHLNRWVKLFFLIFSGGVFLSTLTIESRDWFYKDFYLDQSGASNVLIKEYGFMHHVFYGLVIVYFVLSLGSIIYALLRKNEVSRKILILLIVSEVVSIAAFFGGGSVFPQIELIPASYVFTQIIYLVIVYLISFYDVIETAVETMAESGSAGFITFDLHRGYLGSNETAKEILPDLKTLTVDLPLKRNTFLWNLISPWLDAFESHPEKAEKNNFLYEKDGKTYRFNIEWMAGGKNKRGYQIFIEDDTVDQAYIKLLDNFNNDLKTQVAEKTAHIQEMHDNLVLSMATMVESRDNSTGGHIRRTSEGVRLLIDAMKGMPQPPAGYPMNEEFCRNLIKAAPMHDLGKIAVDDAILRKPGRFTPEEYEIMKTHAAEGARIVHEILKSTDDESFKVIAENVAHYHHERWDGSGYPDKRKGDKIPPEARIMAVADVYDALVSKRVYKESMSFEKADAIIMEGMGSQFDPALEPVYLAAKPKLESYYSSTE